VARSWSGCPIGLNPTAEPTRNGASIDLTIIGRRSLDRRLQPWLAGAWDAAGALGAIGDVHHRSNEGRRRRAIRRDRLSRPLLVADALCRQRDVAQQRRRHFG
jgi:hypothetical protein